MPVRKLIDNMSEIKILELKELEKKELDNLFSFTNREH
jgi:hypothetical protein